MVVNILMGHSVGRDPVSLYVLILQGQVSSSQISGFSISVHNSRILQYQTYDRHTTVRPCVSIPVSYKGTLQIPGRLLDSVSDYFLWFGVDSYESICL